ASSGGIFIAPTLVFAIAATGFEATMVGAATVMAAILIPAIAIGIDRPPMRPQATGVFLARGGSRSGAGSASAPHRWTRGEACGGTVRPSANGPGRFLAPDRLPRTGDWANPGRIDGRPPDRHGDRRTSRAWRIRVASRSSPRDRAIDGKSSSRAVCDDA